MRIEPFEYVKPASVDEACSLLAANGQQARVLAGGTDLLVRMKLGVERGGIVVDIKGLEDLVFVREEENKISIGAGTTVRAIQRAAVIREKLPALAEAAARVASPQLRTMGTIGGNVLQQTMCWFYNQSRQWRAVRAPCNKAGGQTCYVANKADICYATYRGDLAPALIALGATATFRHGHVERTVPLEDIFTGDGKNHLKLEPGQLLVKLDVPVGGTGTSSAFLKLAHRAAIDYPQVSVSASVQLAGKNGECADARIVIGALASGPVRPLRAEDVLRGQKPIAELAGQAAQAAMKYAHPVENMAHGSPSYRREMVRVLTTRALETALARAREVIN